MSSISMCSLSAVPARQPSLTNPGEKPGDVLSPLRTGHLQLMRGTDVPPGAKKAIEGGEFLIEQLQERKQAAGGATQVARLRQAIAKIGRASCRERVTI